MQPGQPKQKNKLSRLYDYQVQDVSRDTPKAQSKSFVVH